MIFRVNHAIDPSGATEEAAEHVRHRNVLQPLLEQDDERTETHAETEARNRLVAERLQLVGGIPNRQDEQEPRYYGPDHAIPRVL